MLHHQDHAHDPLLIGLSILIAIFASYTALDLANSVTAAQGRARLAWLLGGSLAMGVGIWSMHFVAMLAFSIPGIPIAFDIPLLVLSILVAIAASAVSLSIVGRQKVSTAAYVAGSLVMGAAIAGMHYIGIASMRMAATWEWDRALVSASIAIAVAASFVALQFAFRLRNDLTRRGLWYRGAGSLVMGLAIAGMHYTAMAAMTFYPGPPVALAAEPLLATSGLAVSVIVTTLIILGIALTGSIVDRALARRGAMTQEISAILDRLHLALDASKMGTWNWDLQSGVIVWDETSERLFGFAPRAFGGNYASFESVLHPDDRKPVEAALREAIASRADFNAEFRVIWPDQTVHWILASGRSSYDDRGRAMRMLGTSVDITDRKRTEEALREAVRARSEFISVASHELKTPITSIRMQVQMLDRAIKKDGPAAIEPNRLSRMLETSTRQLDRLTRLVEDMLDISRISTGRLAIEMGDHDLSRLVQDILERFGDSCQQAGCELRSEVEPGVIGRFDSFRIEQVVTNLLNNALKYGAGKPIEVVFRPRGRGRAELMVRDQGIGIAKESQERIFQRFERAISGTSITGLGLGLYIAKNIVEAHGGSILVESDPGQGSVFTLDLPLRDADRKAKDGAV